MRLDLSSRLVITVALTITVVLTVFVALTIRQLNASAAIQTISVERLAKQRFDRELALESELAQSLIHGLKRDLDGAILSVASSSETRSVIQRGNIVAIDLLMRRAVENASLDSMIVWDAKLRALGSHRPGLNLLRANSAMQQSAFFKTATDLVTNNDPENPRAHSVYLTGGQDYVEAMGMGLSPVGVMMVSIQPIFDDFGDVIALIMGHRRLTGSEQILDGFIRSWSIGLQINQDGKTLLNIGEGPAVGTARDVFKNCQNFAGAWEFCVTTFGRSMKRETAALINQINDERYTLRKWLIGLSLIAIAVATIVATLATRRVMSPLVQITATVRSVARGNWLAPVTGQKRRDEVGEIARAVEVLQRSVKEREKLQADVMDVEQVREYRKLLAESMRECEQVMRQQIFGLSDVTASVENSSQDLMKLTGLAEAEADEARLVANRTFLSTQSQLQNQEGTVFDGANELRLVRDSVDRLGDTVVRISDGGRELSSSLMALTQGVRGIDQVVKRFLLDVEQKSKPRPDDRDVDRKLISRIGRSVRVV